jgi:glucosamine-6-phosphate deaminase
MNVLRFDSETAWVEAVCSLWRDRLRTKPDLSLCLPTGTTPDRIYAEMARSARAGQASFARARVFVLDEFGGLAPDDPGRTRHTLQRNLIDAIDLPQRAFHFLDPDSADLSRHLRENDEAIGGRFDLVLLGIGRNGHLGMNEPGSPLDGRTRRVALEASTIQSSARYFAHQNLPRWGVTVGLATILASSEVWLLANGPTKAEIIRRTLREEISPSNPASLLRRHPNCWVFVDTDAGALLDAVDDAPERRT